MIPESQSDCESEYEYTECVQVALRINQTSFYKNAQKKTSKWANKKCQWETKFINKT